ncbi:MAG: helix-turn-helix domain-containing protein [Gammaproteobacteria bacterium]|nr:helix-turn-helix domain-containing protein [Gammaproteobacteria bacterium]
MTTESRAVDIIFEEVKRAALSLGHTKQQANDIAASADQRIRSRLGSQEPYIHAPDKAKRNAQIFAEFNGRNQKEVCRKWGISRRTLYRIVGDAYGNR